MDASAIILGFTGSIGSGCSYISHGISEFYQEYKYFKLSDIIKEEFENNVEPTLKQMLDKGNELRKNQGNSVLVKKLINKIKQDNETRTQNNDPILKKFIIDGIKNTQEVETLRQFPYFFLFSVQVTEEDTRTSRVIDNDDYPYQTTQVEFETVDRRDKEEGFSYGQQVKKCNDHSDIVLLNDEYIHSQGNGKRDLIQKIYDRYIKRIEDLSSSVKSVTILPAKDELYMTTAYSVSKMSSCLKRKVGAVIISESRSQGESTNNEERMSHTNTSTASIISTGFNEVPLGSKKCIFDTYEMCYRDYHQEKHAEKFKRCPVCGHEISITTTCESCGRTYDTFKKYCTYCKIEMKSDYKCPECNTEIFREFLPGEKNTPGKLLDMCKALHAEENAILNLLSCGAQNQKKLTIYVTTQPCNLCANKIVSAGIERVVFSEPYPMKESEQILTDAGIKVDRFTGVKSTAYFKLY